MNGRLALFYILLLGVLGCKKAQQDIPILSISPKIVVEEVFASFPGQLTISDDFIVFHDVRSTDTILHIYDKQTGEYINGMGLIGNGPNEFTLPFVSQSSIQNELFVWDLNKYNSGIFHINGLLTGKYTDTYLPIDQNTIDISYIGSNSFLMFNPDSESGLFKVYNSDKITCSFGEMELKPNITQENISILYNGSTISYNPYTDNFLIRFGFPLVQMYERENNCFKLKGEKVLAEYEFIEKDGKCFVELLEPCRVKMSCLTKNYVVLLDDSRMDIEERKSFNSPLISRRQIVVLDYKLDEVKVIDLSMDIYSIGSDGQSDTLYLVVANPDYMIVKITL